MGETGRNPIPQVLGGQRRRCSVNLTTLRVISWNLVPPSLRDLSLAMVLTRRSRNADVV